MRKQFTEDPEQSELPLSEDDLDIGDSGAITTTATTSATSSEQDRTPVVQETPPTAGQDSETVTPPVENTSLPESTTTRCYPSQTRKPPERY